ncbi:MAG: glycosyltransferase [Magnetospirillum sp.]|nr:glycosyltransferase [Magnetospirillum sp.]
MVLAVPHDDVPWSQMPRWGGVLAPVGGRLRRYHCLHLVLLRLWRRLHVVLERRENRPVTKLVYGAAGLALSLWRLLPKHVAAEAAAIHHGAGDQPQGRRMVTAAVTAMLGRGGAGGGDGNGEGGRVLMLTPSLAAGGAERQLVLSARGLAGRGWRVEVWAKHLDDPSGHDALRPDLGDIPVGLIEGAMLGGLADDCLLALPPAARNLTIRLHDLISRRNPAVVHAWMDEMAAWGGLAAVLAGVPRVVLGGRNLAPHRFGLPQLGAMRAALRVLADHPRVSLINNSMAGAADYAEWLGLEPGRISILRNGFVPLEAADGGPWRQRLGIPADTPVVGGMFRLASEKDPLLWLKVAALLADRHPTMRFVIFGAGPLDAVVRRERDRLGLAARLSLPGVTLGREEALALLDVFLLTSRHEGTPNVVLECQSVGLPLVAVAAGGLCEAWADPDPVAADPEALANAVLERLGRRMPSRCDWLEANFGMERLLTETEALYGGGAGA